MGNGLFEEGKRVKGKGEPVAWGGSALRSASFVRRFPRQRVARVKRVVATAVPLRHLALRSRTLKHLPSGMPTWANWRERERIITNAPCPLAPCPMTAGASSRGTRPTHCLPHAPCPMPHAQCPIPHYANS
ncbi:hypothetical protein [Tolypothrix sp. VBCCA 56010]|uniref:hypothetical protein n=1 Tax=Tolypothrix sp. VBCCA 56010 TaxID=3137731 RepID=UPI003D7C6185